MQQIITYTPVLILGSDTALFDVSSDAFLRMQEYGRLYRKVLIFIPTKNGVQEVIEKGNVRVEPMVGGNKISQFRVMVSRTKEALVHGDVGSVIAQDAFMFGFCAWLATRKTKRPFVVGIYGTDIFNTYMRTESLSRRFYTLIARFILPRATAIQTDGPETIPLLREKYGAKVFFKPVLAPDSERFLQINPLSFSIPLRVVFIGRFVKQKNIPLLLEIIKESKVALGNSVHFSVAGSGPEKEDFLREIKREALEEICSDMGVVHREQMPELYMNNHVLILTSYYEGFPKVFMEAALAGMPIISSRVSGLEGLVSDGTTGFILEQGSRPEEWVKKIGTLVQKPELLSFLSKNIRERFVKEYGNKTILDFQRPIAAFIEKYIV